MSYATTLLAGRARELRAAPKDQPVPSPCISVCRMNEGSGLCEGCFRTLEEIAAWAGLDEGGRRAVWGLIEKRIAR